MTGYKKRPVPPALGPLALLGDIRELIDAARQRTTTAVNGEEVLSTLTAQLVRDCGRGFSEENLRRMVKFASDFSDKQIVISLVRQLSWMHFITQPPLKTLLQQECCAQIKPFCLQICGPSILGATDKFRAFKAYAGNVQ